MENKRFLFNKHNIQLIVKATNKFAAMCFANQYMETRYSARFETYDAIELDNDMDFGVITAITAGSVEHFSSDHRYYQKPETRNQHPAMSATKEYFHDQIEQASRLFTPEELAQVHHLHAQNRAARLEPKYNILELQAMNMPRLVEIAANLGLTVGDVAGKQNLMYAILDKQAEINTPIRQLTGDLPTKYELQNKAPFRAGGDKQQITI